MQLEYQLVAGDFEAWWQTQSRRTGIGRLSYWLNVLLLAGGGAYIAWRLAPTTVSGVALSMGGALIGWALAAAAYRLWIRAAATEQTSGSAAQAQLGRHVLQLGPDGVSEEGPAGRHMHGWDAIEGLLDAPGHLFLAVGGGYAYVIPKRELAVDTVADFKAAFATSQQAWDQRRRTKG
jgi:hypothetical protein